MYLGLRDMILLARGTLDLFYGNGSQALHGALRLERDLVVFLDSSQQRIDVYKHAVL